MRFAWDLTFDYLRSKLGRVPKATAVSAPPDAPVGCTDCESVDYIANSQNTARRIWRCYRRPATVITRRSISSDFLFDLKTRFLPYRFPIGEL